MSWFTRVSSFVDYVFSYFPNIYTSSKRTRDECSDADNEDDIGVTPLKRLKIHNAPYSPKMLRDGNPPTVTTVRSNTNVPSKLKISEDSFEPASFTPTKNAMPVHWGRIQDNDGRPPRHVSSPNKSRSRHIAALNNSCIDLTKDEAEERHRTGGYIDLTRSPRKLTRSLTLPPRRMSYVDLTDQDNQYHCAEKKLVHCNSMGQCSHRCHRNSLGNATRSKQNITIDVIGSKKKNRTSISFSQTSIPTIDLQEWNNYGRVLGSLLEGKLNIGPPCTSPTLQGSIDLTQDEEPNQSIPHMNAEETWRSPKTSTIQMESESSAAISSATRNGVKKKIIRVNSFENKLKETPYVHSGWLRKLVKDYRDSCDEFVSTRDRFMKQTQKWSELSQKDIETLLEEKLNRHMKITDAFITDKSEEALPSFILPLPELTSDMERMVKNAFVSKPESEVLVRKFNLIIKRVDIQTLRGLNWLNDEIINYYMQLLEQRAKKRDGFPSLYTFSTFFYANLKQRGYEGVRRWTKKVNIFEMDLIIIPIHLKMHWCLIVIDLKKKTIDYYDSMGHDNFSCLSDISKYIKTEHKSKLGQDLDMNDWKVENIKEIPQQLNGSDCGVFACSYAEFSSRRAPFDFDQSKMPYFRKKMVYEIITGELIL